MSYLSYINMNNTMVYNFLKKINKRTSIRYITYYIIIKIIDIKYLKEYN